MRMPITTSSAFRREQVVQTTYDTFFRYLPVHKRDEKLGLYVTGAGCAVIEPGESYPSSQSHPDFYDFTWSRGRTLPEFHMVWIVAGEGDFQFEKTAASRIRAGSVLMIPPGRWHRYRPSTRSGWTEYWASFNGDIARQWIKTGLIDPQPHVFPVVADELIQRAFHRLFDRLQSPSISVTRLIPADMFELLTLTAGSRSDASIGTDHAAPSDIGDQLVADAVAKIWSAGRESISVDELVDEMLVARRTLERAFRRQLGHGVHEEILHCRLERTKQLLADRSLSMDDIAIQSGFGNVRSLRRAFTSSEGMSPQAYRQVISAGTQGDIKRLNR